MSNALYIIDGHWHIFRGYYAPMGDLTSPSGEPTKATYVFFSTLMKLIETRRPTHLAMAVDGPIEQLHRKQLYDDYKATRKPMPEDLPVQIDRIFQIVEAMGIPILRAPGYEADDIMATAATELAGPDTQVFLVTRDKDIDQLVGGDVAIYDPTKGQVITAETVEQIRGYPPDKAVEAQTLMGDSIDNIPGIVGVGPKKAAALIAKYGSAQAVLEHADELTPKLRENVLAWADTIDLTRKLVTLDRDVPIDLPFDEMRLDIRNREAVGAIFAELGFKRLQDQLNSICQSGRDDDVPAPPSTEPGAPADVAVPAGLTTASQFDYTCVDTPEALAALAKQLSGVKRLAIDTETTSVQPMWATLVGLSVSWAPGKAAYVPVKAPLGEKTLDTSAVREAIGPMLVDESVTKIGHNLKYDLIVLEQAGFELAGPLFDTMIAAYVLDSSRPSLKLDSLAEGYLAHRCIPIGDVIGTGRNRTTMDAVPTEIVAPYAAEDADVAGRLADALSDELDRQKTLAELFEKLEMPLMPVLAEMEQVGIALDPQALKRMQTDLSAQSDAMRDKIIAAAGRPFNVDSPKQLAEVLFGDLEMPVTKRTKTGPSTDSSVLEGLAVEHELPAMVLEYRKLTKLLSTYVTSLGQCIHPTTGRVHTSFRQTGTVTGRLSSSDPNLQNIPVRTEQGRQIRSAFIASPGCVLLSADYSQVELRVLAHFCQDPTLMSAFEADQDIHRIVAAEVFGVLPEEVTADQRARAKTVNFGIIYGQTAYGLGRTLRIRRSDAQDFIVRYRKRFPKIDQFLRDCVAQAKDRGYVETIFGRRRTISEIDSRNPARRAAAERLAINSVVQGSAADLIKQAMINIAARIRRQNRPSRMLLQIHDELLFDIPTDAVDGEREMIVEEMSGAISLNVPLKVDVAVAANWMDAK